MSSVRIFSTYQTSNNYGWTPTEGESSRFTVGALRGFFDIQAYDPEQRSWVSSNFFYSFNNPVETFLTVAKEALKQKQVVGKSLTDWKNTAHTFAEDFLV